MTTTSEDFAYGSASNLFGSDPETAEEHAVLVNLNWLAQLSHEWGECEEAAS